MYDSQSKKIFFRYLNNELCSRKEKLKKLRKNGFSFPNDFRRDTNSEQLHAQYDDISNDELEDLNINVSIAGRMMTRRIMGKVAFVTIQDMGGKIQLYVARDDLHNGFYNEYFKKFDLGDIIGARGKLFKTRTGELSIHCIKISLLTKAIRPLPDKFHGIADQEIRYRKRYIDLIANEKSRNIFKMRSSIIYEIRNFMMNKDFIEVETPMMQAIPGGAAARPFMTHHNALDIDMYLRIAPELYLKRLVVGGFERVFEINRNFRNEGLSPRHNPEFTMMELYMAYADYLDMIKLLEDLLRTITHHVLGSNVIQYGKQLFEFDKPFTKMTMKQAICYYNPKTHPDDLDDIATAIAISDDLGIKIEKGWGLGRIQTKIFEKTAVSNLMQPTFITAYPAEISPLARLNDENKFFADRFEFFIGGQEIGNGFSELNDAEDQANRFVKQVQEKDYENENNNFDEDYITALEYGLPPTAGLGIGIDRLMMIFTNSNTIRDVILFPALRPQK